MDSTVTFTYSEQVENHHGMQKLGQLADTGLSHADLQTIAEKLPGSQIIDLRSKPTQPEAYILIVRGGVTHAGINPDEFYREAIVRDWDKKAFMRGAVKNKKARHNICIGEVKQEADYEHGKGTVYSFDEMPNANRMRKFLGTLHPKLANLQCEGNHYYDTSLLERSKTYIGFHGDAERRIVAAVRLGLDFPLHYQW